jgi:hypothetical protein
MSEHHHRTPRAPAPTEDQVIQITAVPITGADANYVVVYALTAGGSIWRHQGWNMGVWELMPPLPAPETTPA